MPNDAKLGLLAGVVGVILAAVLSSRSQHDPKATHPPTQKATSKATSAAVEAKPAIAPNHSSPEHPATPDYHPIPEPTATMTPVVAAVKSVGTKTMAALPAELPSTPVVRTKREFDATPASRSRDDDLDR